MPTQETGRLCWTEETWNPVTGCTKVSAGCKHCYAERIVGRFGHARIHKGLRVGRAKFSDVVCHPDRLSIPLHWRKPRKVFVCSMGDLFHEAVPDEFIKRVVATMTLCPAHTFQILTKRPGRMLAFYTHPQPWPTATLDNVWLGVSVEDQATADARTPLLLQTPAAVRFVSYEPALGPVNFECFPSTGCPTGWLEDERGIDWIICGSESGPKARPMHIELARSVRDQCVTNDLPFFYKQGPGDDRVAFSKAPQLDGRTWREFPR